MSDCHGESKPARFALCFSPPLFHLDHGGAVGFSAPQELYLLRNGVNLGISTLTFPKKQGFRISCPLDKSITKTEGGGNKPILFFQHLPGR